MVVQATLFRWSPRRADGFRASLLRAFGARIGRPRVLRATVKVEVPWNLRIGEGVRIGDHANLYSLGVITIGDHAVISQHAHLCAGTHDFTLTGFPLIRPPITVERHAWIAAEAFVGPYVTIGEGAVVGARSVATRDLPAWMICTGFPAAPVRARALHDDRTGARISPAPPSPGEDPHA